MPVAEPKGARREPEYPPKFRLNLPTVPVLVPRTALELQGRSNGGIWGIYTLPKSGQVNFICGNNDVRTVIEHFIPPQKTFIPPKQISGYAPGNLRYFTTETQEKNCLLTGAVFTP